MSMDLLEIGGMIAAVVALTAIFHRALYPQLERLARRGRLGLAHPGAERAGIESFGRNPLQSRPVSQSRLRSPA